MERHNAYYFYNVKSKETTWDNPLTQPAAAAPARTAPAPDLGGVDPELAYLDPSLSSSSSATGGGSAVTARFNARTGKFQGGDPTKNPEYHSDYARAKRQSSAFFDVDAWEKVCRPLLLLSTSQAGAETYTSNVRLNKLNQNPNKNHGRRRKKSL